MKPAARPAAATPPPPQPKASARPAPRPARATGVPTRPVLEGAKALRDAIERSKLTAGDPWRYTPKARKWGERAQRLVDAAVGGRDGELGRELHALATEVGADPDYREARRRF